MIIKNFKKTFISSLQYIKFHNQSLPSSFCSLTHIIRLDLSKNKLTELPQNFGNLRQLHYLDLYENLLTSLPVSCYHLRNLGWLDLKNNPLNQKLKAVAGDCLDEKQCQQSAKKVVEYFKTVNSELERQKQKVLQQEREREAAKKAEEELELKRQKEQKKAEKLRRKAQRQGEKRREEQDVNNADSNSATTVHDSKQNGYVPLQKQKANSGSMLKWFVLLAIIFPAMALCGEIGYHVYSGKQIVSVAQLQQLLTDDWTVLKNTIFAALQFLVNEEKRLLQLLMTKWKDSTDRVSQEQEL